MDVDYDYDPDDNSDCDDCDTPSGVALRNNYYERLGDLRLHTHSTHPRPELKIFDSTGILFPAVSFNYSSITNIPQGTGVSQRLGNQVTIASVSWNFLPTLPADPSAGLRAAAAYYLIYDKQANGNAPSSADIFTSITGSVNLGPFQHLNPNGRSRFILLKKWVYPSPLNSSLNYETGKLRIDLVSTFSGSVPITGSITFWCIGNNNTSGAVMPFIFRVRYYDN